MTLTRHRLIAISLTLPIVFIVVLYAVRNFGASSAIESGINDQPEGRVSITVGKQLYDQGDLLSGQSIVGRVSGDIRLTGEQASCASCHQRSAMGSSEGKEVVPALRGNILFKDVRLPTGKPPNAPILRPAYSNESLRKAIRDGIGSDGKEFNALMPRYPLSDEQIDSISAYLQSLSLQAADGVDEHDIHFATIIGKTVDPAERKAILDVFDTFFAQKNNDTRHETQRAEHAPWHKAWIMESYRKWTLHVWELQGPSNTWQTQLERLYREQPVFAVLNGKVAGAWQPIHEFCENHALPCLFPTTDLPFVERQSNYVFYFDQGMKGQARAAAAHLSRNLEPGAHVMQFHRIDDERGSVAAAEFTKRLDLVSGIPVSDHSVTGLHADWSSLSRDSVAVIWLDKTSLESLWKRVEEGHGPKRIYLSTSLFGDRFENVPPSVRDRVTFIHPYAMPKEQKRGLIRSKIWLKMNGIASKTHQRLQANAYFTLMQTGLALKRIRGYFLRDYFYEGIEHLIDNAVFTSVYPRLSLAPGQRFVSKGVHIVKLTGETNSRPVLSADWLIY